MALAQKPFINSISPTHVEVGETVTISGSNLTNVNRVFFGGVSVTGGDVNVISDNLVEATVPAGATNGSVIVQTTTDLIAESSQHFYISFSGSGATSWKTEFLESLSPKTNAYDICVCDLNGDQLNDALVTHNVVGNGGVQLSVLQNNSTFNSEAFSDIAVGENTDVSAGFISATCGDLDGDGKPEAIFTSDLNSEKQILIYQNTSTIGTVSLNYLSSLDLALPEDPNNEIRVARRIKVSDIDGDGKLDLVVGNEKDNSFHIFPNSSTGPANFSFGAPIELTAGNATSTGALDIGDFDNDGKPDVVIVPAAKANELIYVMRNQSIPGNISFSSQSTAGSADQRRNVVIGDFDNDGLNDIAVTTDRTISSTSGVETVEVFRNTTAGNTISFTSATAISIPSNLPWGIDAGDLNGDGFLDIAITTLGVSTGSVYVVENQGGSGINFNSPTALAVPNDARNICIADLDMDGRPDLAYTQNTRGGTQGDLGVRLNQTCIAPSITPSTFSFCSGENFTLEATNTSNATYTWTILPAGTPISTSGNSATFNIASTSDETIEVQIDQGACSTTEQIVVTYEPGSKSGPPVITVNDTDAGDICAGDQVTLATSVSFDEYLWTLPDGTTSTSPTIDFTSISTSDAGDYTVVVRSGTDCSSNSVTQNIEVKQLPLLEIINNDLDNFCSDLTLANGVTLEVSDYRSDGFTYEWQLNGSDFGAGSVASITTNQAGSYTVEVTNATTCVSETASYTINSVALPTSDANGPSETCVDFQTSFTSASTGEGAFTLQYEWVVEDATDSVIHTATTQDLDFTFPSTGNYEVILNTNYDPTEVYAGPNPGDICVSSDPIAVTVSAAPSITFDQTDLTAKCQAESLTVGLSSPNSATIQSYAWTIRNAQNDTIISTATTNSLDVTTPIGVDTVWVEVDITTTIGCQVKDSIRIRNFPSDLDISSTDFNSVLEFDSALLEEATSINLSADNAISDISWGPDPEQFSNPTEANTIFFPQNPTSTVTLTATDNNGCAVSTEVRIVLDNIRPKRTFSPNGDNMNDCWEILNIGDLGESAGCKVYVFDSRGRKISTKEDFIAGDNCVWDGNFNNSPVPEGVYYFVMKCEDSNFSKSGSILLAR